jgi:tetratricopeptide (TPR) repeat protein
MGRVDEAIAARTRSLELDPLNARTSIALGRDYMAAGQYERAEAMYRRSIDLDSMSPLLIGTGPGLPAGPGEVYLREGRDSAAVEEYLRVAERRGVSSADRDALRHAFAEGGMRGFWRRWLPLETHPSSGAPRAMRIAATYARIGDTAQAIEWMERAFQERDPGLVYLLVDPEWDGVRDDPRVQSLLERMKLRR